MMAGFCWPPTHSVRFARPHFVSLDYKVSTSLSFMKALRSIFQLNSDKLKFYSKFFFETLRVSSQRVGSKFLNSAARLHSRNEVELAPTSPIYNIRAKRGDDAHRRALPCPRVGGASELELLWCDGPGDPIAAQCALQRHARPHRARDGCRRCC